MNNYVIGAGVAGLTLAMYDTNFKIFDDNPLGLLKNKYTLGPRLLQYNKWTREFFFMYEELLGFLGKVRINTAQIGFSENHFIADDASEGFKKKYSKITRNREDYEHSFLSAGKNSIDHFIFDGCEDNYIELFKRMERLIRSRGQIIDAKVQNINLNKKTIVDSNNVKYDYDNLVSTIPVTILFSILGKEIPHLDFSTNKKHFYIAEYNSINEQTSKKYAYVYSVDGKYTRKTFFKDYITFETVEHHDAAIIDGCKIIDAKENFPIQITKSHNIQDVNEIYMLGRLAQWRHDIRFDTLPEIITKIREHIYG